MAILMIGVFIASLIFGILIDKIGTKIVAILAMLLGIISFIILAFFTHSIILTGVALFLFGFVTSSIGIVAPAMASTLFGSINYSEIYSSAAIGLAMASIIALPGYGFIFDIAGSYMPALYSGLLLFSLNILFVVLAFKNKDKLISEGAWIS